MFTNKIDYLLYVLLFFKVKNYIENKLPLHTIGSLAEKSRLQIMFNLITSIFKSPKPEHRSYHSFVQVFKRLVSCTRG